jgi:hypothetical protein
LASRRYDIHRIVGCDDIVCGIDCRAVRGVASMTDEGRAMVVLCMLLLIAILIFVSGLCVGFFLRGVR